MRLKKTGRQKFRAVDEARVLTYSSLKKKYSLWITLDTLQQRPDFLRPRYPTVGLWKKKNNNNYNRDARQIPASKGRHDEDTITNNTKIILRH